MRWSFISLVVLTHISGNPGARSQDIHTVNNFQHTEYLEDILANTAENEDYLTSKEKEVFYYLNLVRINPGQFAETYLSRLKHSSDSYERGLYQELHELSPLPILKPNHKLWESARCHAEESGKRGYLGHDRFRCEEYFMGECCYYGVEDAFDIIVDLLIDQGVSSLGHRKICLSPSYTELGVSIRPHKTYGSNTVLDFR